MKDDPGHRFWVFFFVSSRRSQSVIHDIAQPIDGGAKLARIEVERR